MPWGGAPKYQPGLVRESTTPPFLVGGSARGVGGLGDCLSGSGMNDPGGAGSAEKSSIIKHYKGKNEGGGHSNGRQGNQTPAI